MALLSIVTDSRESTEASVYERYAAASRQVEPALCCPVQYAGQYLKVVPQEIIDKDYGCGDPSAWVNAGDTVLDLGSGTGKLCYIMSQVVGPQGKVIGVDCNIEMLELSRKYRDEVAGKIGYSNVEFRYGLIQDLQLDLDLLNNRRQFYGLRCVELRTESGASTGSPTTVQRDFSRAETGRARGHQ